MYAMKRCPALIFCTILSANSMHTRWFAPVPAPQHCKRLPAVSSWGQLPWQPPGCCKVGACTPRCDGLTRVACRDTSVSLHDVPKAKAQRRLTPTGMVVLRPDVRAAEEVLVLDVDEVLCAADCVDVRLCNSAAIKQHHNSKAGAVGHEALCPFDMMFVLLSWINPNSAWTLCRPLLLCSAMLGCKVFLRTPSGCCIR
jgi:hypothetical protein